MSDPVLNFEGESITLHKLLERSARAALDLQRKDGSFPPGRNGIYDEPETPVRTTSHWLATLSKVYKITGDEEFANAANNAADYLLSDEARPHGYTFHSRNAKGKDKCDGLVGQAAPIRGLAWAGSVLGRQELYETAEEVYSLHPFNKKFGLWERVEVNGANLSFDRTLNHQILFAGASAHLMCKFPTVERQIKRFVTELNSNMDIHIDGIIKHYIRPSFTKTISTVMHQPRHWRLMTNNIFSCIYSLSRKRKQKEVGYHPVNLRGIVHMKIGLSEVNKWHKYSGQFMIEKIVSDKTLSKIDEKQFQYGGTIPGIDASLALSHLRKEEMSRAKQQLESNIMRCYNFNTDMLSKETTDPNLQASAITYAVDLPNMNIALPN